MQGVLIEKPYQFTPPIESTWPQRIAFALGVDRWLLRSKQGLVDVEVRGKQHLTDAVAAGHGVVLTPNHPRTTDPMVMCRVIAETGIPFFTMASWHLFNHSARMTWAIRAMGAFSMNREGLDKASVDFAVKVLQEARRPLLIFPEGTTSRTNDQLMALMDGPAFIARTAAKRRKKTGGKVVVLPVGIRYLFQGDVEEACRPVLEMIEQKLTWKPLTETPLVDRIVKVGDALLRLKELEYDLRPGADQTLRQRQTQLVNRLLHPLEQQWLGEHSEAGIAIRIKNLRMKIMPELTRQHLPQDERERRWKQLGETYLAQQIDCYPDRYLTEHPSVDRVLELVEKFEEDLTDKSRVHRPMKVIVDIGVPVEVSPERDRKAVSDPLTDEIEARLKTQMRELQQLSPMYEAKS